MTATSTLGRSRRVVPSGNIRTLIYQFVQEQDALAEWKSELDEWINDISVFREAENHNVFLPEQVSDTKKRFHRMLLHSLLATGERLALDLEGRSQGISSDEITKQREYVEAFLDNLRCTLIAFYRNREAKADKPSLLAKYF